MTFWKDDVAVLLGSDLGVPVVFGLITAYGHYNRESGRINDVDSGMRIEVVPSVIMKIDAFPTMPVKGSSLIVDGVAVTVRDVTPIDDGQMVEIGVVSA